MVAAGESQIVAVVAQPDSLCLFVVRRGAISATWMAGLIDKAAYHWTRNKRLRLIDAARCWERTEHTK